MKLTTENLNRGDLIYCESDVYEGSHLALYLGKISAQMGTVLVYWIDKSHETPEQIYIEDLNKLFKKAIVKKINLFEDLDITWDKSSIIELPFNLYKLIIETGETKTNRTSEARSK